CKRRLRRFHGWFALVHIYSVFARFRFRLRGYSGAKVSKTALTKRLRPTVRNLPFINHSSFARVVEWQTRTFEGRMPKGMRVQVPPRAPMKTLDVGRKWNRSALSLCTWDRPRSEKCGARANKESRSRGTKSRAKV